MSALDVQTNVPLAPLTTLELGGNAKHFVEVVDEQTLVDALSWAADHQLPSAILAGGSNVIVPDRGYDGLVIHMEIGGLELRDEGVVEAGAGVPWHRVVDAAIERHFAGIECLAGIPGSTGATPIQNVGAYGQEVAEVIEHVRVLDRNGLSFETLTSQECGFEYRSSRFKRSPGRFVVCAVRFHLQPHGARAIRYPELRRAVPSDASLEQVRDAVLGLRRRKSMVLDPDDSNRRSAGSFFLNPVVAFADADRVAEQAVREGLVAHPSEVPRFDAGGGRVKLAAGWLVEKAGFAKGTRRGPIGISSKHALCLVHHGGGTTAQLLAFAEEIQSRVQDRFGVSLEREPQILV
jgi:UDP-N-acetylmuramate dehydrogenase